MELERLKVIIEATTKPYRDELSKAKAETKKFSQDVKKNIDKSMDASGNSGKGFRKTSQEVKNMTNLIRRSLDRVFDSSPVAKAQEKIREYMSSVKQASGIQTPTAEYKDLERAVDGATQALKGLKAKQQELVATGGHKKKSQEYVELEKCIRDAERTLTRLIARQDKMSELGVGKNSRQWKTLQYDITETKNGLNAFKIDMQNLKAEGGDSQYSDAWRKIQAEIDVSEQKLRRYISEMRKLKTEGRDTEFAPASAVKKFGAAGKSVSGASGRVKSKMSGLNGAFRSVTAGIKKTGGAFASLINRFSSGDPAIRRTDKSLKRLGNTGRGLNGMLKTLGITFRFMMASMLIMGTIRFVKEGFQNLAQYSGDVNNSLSMLMSSLTQLKNELASAFAPILNVVAPILDAFIQKIISVVNVIGQLMSALTGKGSYIQAKKVSQDYAASLDKNTDSANKADKANKELQRTLLGFDEINKLDDPSSYDTPNTDKESTGLTPGDMFEEVPIDGKVQQWANKIRDALKEIWDIAEPTRRAIERLWNEGLVKLKDFTFTGIKDFWNNYLKPMGKWMLGDEAGLPRFFNITNDPLNEIDWNRLNGSLADFFTMLQKPTKFVWTGLMDFYERFLKPVAVWTMSDGIPQLVDALTEFGNKIHWNEINDALVNLWDALAPFTKSVGQGLINFLKDLLNVGADFINGVVPDGLNKLAEAIKKIKPETAEKIGYNLGRLLVAIMAFKGIGAVAGVFAPFGKALTGAFSGVMKLFTSGGVFGKGGIIANAFGHEGVLMSGLTWLSRALKIPVSATISIIAGIALGIVDLWKTSETFRDNVKKMWDIISDAFASAKKKIWDEGLKPLWDSLKELFGSLYQSYEESGLKWIFEQVVTGIGYIVTYVLAGLIEGIGNAVKFITGVVKVIVDLLKALIDGFIWLKDKVLQVWDWITEKFNAFKQWLKDVFSTDWSKRFGFLGEILNKFLSGVKDVVENAKRFFKGVIDFVAGVFTGDWNRAWQGIKSIFSSIWQGFIGIVRTPVNTILSLCEGMANGIISAFNAAKRALNSINLKVPSWVPVVGGKSLGFNFGMTGKVKLPRLADGGVLNQGQAFIARESGPELVGRYGSRSAVMNNDQIVESVSRGVEAAVHRVFGDKSNDATQPIFNIYVGGKKVTDVVIEEVNKRTRSTGECPILI